MAQTTSPWELRTEDAYETIPSINHASIFIKLLVRLEKQLYRHPLYRGIVIFQPMRSVVAFLFKLPFRLFYWFYIFPVVFFWSLAWSHAFEPSIKILCKRSELINSLFEHILALSDIVQRIRFKMSTTKWSDLLRFAINTVHEIIITLLYSARPSHECDFINNGGVRIGTELVEYFEYEDEGQSVGDGVNKRRLMKGMHSFIPTNLFTAKVRVNMTDIPGDSKALAPIPSDNLEEYTADADSPASFPSTPFSRHYVMNRTAERVASIMFAARDRLRMEALSVSRDEYSRICAKENQSTGQYAIFDPRNVATGINLTCGNHCAMKVGKSLCSSCKSMIPIRANSYVYVEYSVTSSSSQVPTIGIGVSPDDCPLNVMVGSWPFSAGLYTDGQLLISSQFFQSSEGASSVDAGSTIGMLIYLARDFSLRSTVDDFLREQSEPEENLPPPKCTPLLNCNPVLLKFNINGVPLVCSQDMTVKIQELAGSKLPLYPTVSLFSEETRVWCRFCEADIIYRSRTVMQAPPNVKVYCLDGSLLLNESQ